MQANAQVHTLWRAASAAKRGVTTVASLLARGGIVARRYVGTLGGTAGAVPLNLLFVGRMRFAREFEVYFRDVAERGIEPAATLFRGNLLELAMHRGRLAREAAVADVVAWEVFPGSVAQQHGAMHFPMLDASLRVERSLAHQIRRVRSSGTRRTMRHVIRQNGYREWLESGPEAFERFQATLHTPYARARFGAWGTIDDSAALRRRYAKHGRILFVARRERPDEPVCGTLLFDPGGGVLVYHANGFASAAEGGDGGAAEHTAALELALMRHAIEGRYTSIDLGYTRAILTDGLFVHKRRLGCTFAPVPGSPMFRVHVRDTCRAPIFARYPLLCGMSGAWTALLGYDDASPRRSKQAWRAAMKGYRVPGLAGATAWTNAQGDRARDPLGEPAFRLAISETLDLPDGVDFRVDE